MKKTIYILSILLVALLGTTPRLHAQYITNGDLGRNDSAALAAAMQTNNPYSQEQEFDEKKAAELEKKIRESTFTLDDYLEQFEQIKNMGSMEQLLGMMPGVNASALKDAQVDEKALARTEAIIKSMTKQEREHPELLNASRKQRIANGSGTSVQEVNRVLKQFEQTKQMMKQMKSQMGRYGKGMF